MTETMVDPHIGTAYYPDLAGKVAVVTGGSRGIGAATATALAGNGVAVAVVGRDRGAIDSVVTGIGEQGGRAIGVVADCTVEDDLVSLRRQVSEGLGPVDVVMAFAGGNGMPVHTADETGSHWRAVLESDLTATFLTVSALLPDLAVSRAPAVVAMSSSAGRQAAGSSAAYAAAKAGIVALTRHLAAELAGDGIRVNCVAPSTIEHERLRTWVPAEVREQLAAGFPLARLGRPEDVAGAALFLASEASSWITGITVDVAGGRVML